MAKETYTYSAVREPKWNVDGTTINCWVKFDHIPNEVPFTASPYDVEPHGREIHARCAAEEFGPVAPPDPAAPPPEMPIELTPELKGFQSYLEDANQENASGSERGSVLVHSSFADMTLRQLLEAFLAGEPSQLGNLFEFNGPLGTFSARISLSYHLGLLTETERRALNTIRGIRNAFAHRIGETLTTQSNADKCRQLYDDLVGDGIVFSPRLKFAAACISLSVILHNRALKIGPEKRTVRATPATHD